MRNIVLPVLAAMLVAGCATTEYTVEPRQEKEYVTGSNIPRRDRTDSGVTVATGADLERVQNAAGGPTKRGGEVPRN